jgi:hypothetical protein
VEKRAGTSGEVDGECLPEEVESHHADALVGRSESTHVGWKSYHGWHLGEVKLSGGWEGNKTASDFKKPHFHLKIILGPESKRRRAPSVRASSANKGRHA